MKHNYVILWYWYTVQLWFMVFILLAIWHRVCCRTLCRSVTNIVNCYWNSIPGRVTVTDRTSEWKLEYDIKHGRTLLPFLTLTTRTVAPTVSTRRKDIICKLITHATWVGCSLVSVCVSVRAIKEKRLELSAPKWVEIWSMAGRAWGCARRRDCSNRF